MTSDKKDSGEKTANTTTLQSSTAVLEVHKIMAFGLLTMVAAVEDLVDQIK